MQKLIQVQFPFMDGNPNISFTFNSVILNQPKAANASGMIYFSALFCSVYFTRGQQHIGVLEHFQIWISTFN